MQVLGEGKGYKRDFGPNTECNNMEILTASEICRDELAKQSENPIPHIRIRTSVRFRKVEVESSLTGLVQNKAA
jgi:hypothetical protein